MKCLSVKQPYASQIASGVKSIELRTWAPRYRGPLVICSSVVRDRRFRDLPSGVCLCVVELLSCRDAVPSDSAAACFDLDPDDDFFAWVFGPPLLIPSVAVTGKLGLFAPSVEVLNALRANDASMSG